MGIKFSDEVQVINSLKSTGRYEEYKNFSDRRKKEFMDFCCGRSLKTLTYDVFFKKIFNYQNNPKRLTNFLSAILGFEVREVEVLPLDSERLIESGSILIMDLLVRTMEGSLINVEIQKWPYSFTGARESCYISDLVMRQYNYLKAKAKENEEVFLYKQMKPVYTIIFFEKSYNDMLNYPDVWEHNARMRFDDDLKVDFLENIKYIRLDNFRKIVQNVSTEKEAWVYLLSADTPERIMKAAGYSQEMFDIVKELSAFSQKAEEVVAMFSEALYYMDKNAEKYMIDELTEEVEKCRAEAIDAKSKAKAEAKARAEAESKLKAQKAEAESKLKAQKAEAESKLSAQKTQSEAKFAMMEERIRQLEAELANSK